MKKAVAIACAAVMALSCSVFAACGGTGGGDGLPDKGEFLGLAEGEEFTTDSEVLLTFTRPVQNSAQEAWWEETITAFNEEYAGRIRVTVTTLTRGNSREYEEQIDRRASSNDLTDVLYIDGPFISHYANAGTIVPIDNYLYEGYTDDFMDYVIEQNTYNDRLYALSIVDSTVVLFYNKDMLREKRISVPTELDDAWTWDKLKEIALDLHGTSGSLEVYGLQIAGDAGEWLSYAFTPLWEDGVIDSAGQVTTGYLNGDAGVSAGEYLRSLVSERAVSKSTSGTQFSAQNPTAAMALSGTQNISTYLATTNMCDWGVTFYPAGENGVAAPCGGWTLAISKNCSESKRVAAAEFIKYLTSEETCESCARATASPPSRASLYDTMPEYSDPSNEYYDIYSVIKEQLLGGAQLRPKTVGYSVFSSEMSSAISDIIYSASDPRTRLTKAATSIDDAIAKIKIY